MARGRPHLLVICNWDRFFVSHWRTRVEAAAADGFAVTVALPTPVTLAEGIAQRTFPLNRKGRSPVEEARSWLALHSLVRDVRPDLVQTITIKPNLYVGTALRAVGDETPLLMTVTGFGTAFLDASLPGRVQRAAVVAAFRFAAGRPRTAVAFENDEDADTFRRFGIGREDRRFVLPGSGVDLARFDATALPDAGVPIVVLPGRMLRDKGIGEFVEASRRLKSAGVAARMVLVGGVDEGNRTAIPAATLARWQDEGLVEWWGLRHDMPDVLARASIVCLPSYREGLPMALVEGAAAGRPLVATDVPGCRAVARPGRSGVLVGVRDGAALADGLAALLTDPMERSRLGAGARAMAEAEYALPVARERTLAAYRAMLEAR